MNRRIAAIAILVLALLLTFGLVTASAVPADDEGWAAPPSPPPIESPSHFPADQFAMCSNGVRVRYHRRQINLFSGFSLNPCNPAFGTDDPPNPCVGPHFYAKRVQHRKEKARTMKQETKEAKELEIKSAQPSFF